MKHRKYQKLCLIELPNPYAEEPAMDIPLGLAYISSYLKQYGFSDIKLVDYNLYQHDYYDSDQYLKELPTDSEIYGIHCLTPQFIWLKQVSQYLQKVNPEALVIVGGPHATNRPEECIRVADVDVVVINDGEETILEIMQGNSLEGVKGIVYREKRQIKRTPPRPWIEDIDKFPFPDRDLVDIDCYKRTLLGHRAVHLVTLRGCPYNCSFCDKKSVGRMVRWRSVENVLAEMDLITAKYGIKFFVIYDDIFTLRPKRVINFCKEFKKRGIRWRGWSRADLIDHELLTAMKDSGLTSLTFGIESGDNRMLKIFNKGITTEQNERALMLCKEVGIPVRASIIYGGPGETKESVDNTIDLIVRTQPDEWNISTLIPIPGSNIGDHPEKFGVHVHNDSCYKNYHRLGESGMGNITVDIDTLTPEEYEKLRCYMVKTLEQKCPRRLIQDTIQHFPSNL